MGEVNFDDSSIPNTFIEFRFKVDGIIWHNPRCYVERYNAASTFGIRFSVAMQNYNSTMPAGTHTVSVVGRGADNLDIIYAWSLFVLTFK